VFALEELLAAVERVLTMMPDPDVYRVLPRPLDVEGATQRITELLEERGTLGWRDLLGPRPTLVDVLSCLVALLELARRGLLVIRQPAAFSPLVIERGTTHQAA
jgi:chromatin segregation and condensation protein Rec8/ScpA/Scc1 (kleisin family)